MLQLPIKPSSSMPYVHMSICLYVYMSIYNYLHLIFQVLTKTQISVRLSALKTYVRNEHVYTDGEIKSMVARSQGDDKSAVSGMCGGCYVFVCVCVCVCMCVCVCVCDKSAVGGTCVCYL
jgi:hypothetical protein